MSLHRKLSVSGVLLGMLLSTRILPAQNPAADLVLIHGHILTVDANDSVAQAIAVSRVTSNPEAIPVSDPGLLPYCRQTVHKASSFRFQ